MPRVKASIKANNYTTKMNNSSGPLPAAPGQHWPKFQYTTLWKKCQAKFHRQFQQIFFPKTQFFCANCQKL
jgi:hypothetical protein